MARGKILWIVLLLILLLHVVVQSTAHRDLHYSEHEDGDSSSSASDAVDSSLSKASRLPVEAASKARSLSPQAESRFQDCLVGIGPLASLQPACRLLKQGFNLGNSAVELLDLQFPECGHPCVEATIDMEQWFGASNMPLCVMRIEKAGSSIGMTINFERAVRVTMQSFFDRFIYHDTFSGLNSILNELRVSEIGLDIRSFAVNVNPVGVRISGKAFFLDVNFNFNVLVAKIGGKPVFSLDMIVPGPSMNRVVNTLLGPLANTLNIFTITSMDFTLSNAKVEISEYPSLAWQGVHLVPKGLGLTMSSKFNAASKNPLIAFLARMASGEFFTSLETDGKTIDLALHLPNFIISDKFTMKDTRFVMRGSMQPPKLAFGIQSSLAVKIDSSNTLTFGVAVETRIVDPSVSLRLTMEGTWYNAFGIKKLSIGDIVGEVTLMARVPWFAALELGGTLGIGDLSDNERIVGKIYFRVDVQSPSSNYFFGSVTRVTIGSLLRLVFGVKTQSIPKIIANSGFPKGAQVSYSVLGTTTLAGDPVPMGFNLKGTANFLGFEMKADIILAPTHVKFYLEASPLQLGPLKLLRSPTNSREGPLVNVEGSMSPLRFKALIEGYISLPMFSSYVKIAVDDNSMEFTTKTIFFHLVQASIYVHASYGKRPADASFKFVATLETGSMREGVIKSARAFREAVTKKMRAAIDKLNRAERQTRGKIDNACNNVKDCGFKCPKLMELSSEDRESMGMFIETKEHELFDVSVEEYERYLSFQRVQKLSELHESQLIEMGVLLSNEQAGEVLHESLIEEMSQLDDESREHLEQIASSRSSEVFEEGVPGWMKKAGRGLKKAGGAIKKTAKKAGGAIKKTAKKTGGAIKKGAHKAGRVIKKGAHQAVKKVGRVAVDAGKKIDRAGRNAINGACKTGAKVCAGACKVGTKAGSHIVGAGFAAAKAPIQAIEKTIAGATQLLETMVKNFDVKISVGGGLSPTEVSFQAEFSFRLGSMKESFRISINFKRFSLKDIIDMIWQHVKRLIISKVPGLSKYA